MLKKVRVLSKSSVSECAIIFIWAYISYVAAELWHFSGIITLLSASVTMANYAWYNLSPQGKQSSTVIFQFIGFLAEGFVFSYLGLTFFSYKEFMWSMELIYVEFVIILIGRGLGTFGLIGLLKSCGYEKNNKRKITMKELLFIWYAGLIRGAIAFGLVLRMSPEFTNRNVIVTTCLTLVVFSTIFFGSTVGLLGKFLFDASPIEPGIEEADAEEDAVMKEALDDSYLLSLPSDVRSNISGNSSVSDLRAPLIHYNDQEEADSSDSSEADKMKPKKKGKALTCTHYIRAFDELIMRPIFIYHYEKRMHDRAREFYDLFMHEGQKIEEQYEAAAAEQRREDKS